MPGLSDVMAHRAFLLTNIKHFARRPRPTVRAIPLLNKHFTLRSTSYAVEALGLLEVGRGTLPNPKIKRERQRASPTRSSL